MTADGFALFDSPIGRCGIVWSGRGIAAVQLPESRDLATRARIQKRFPDVRELAPPRAVQRAIDGIESLLRGEKSALGAIELDLSAVPPFQRRVYEAARAIAPGETLTYGALAARLGEPDKARAVGQALGRNPFAILVPCHRVLAANGKLGGFSANGGAATKLRLLALEGAHAAAQPALFEGDGRLDFDPKRALAHLRAADPTLARVIERVGPFALELKKTSHMFGMLSEAIVYQQLNGRAAATIYGRVCALFPHAHHGPTPKQILRATDAKLRGAGLSRAKVLALRDLAKRSAAGEIPSLAEARDLDDAALVERLTAVRGIGRWTVEMLLIFRLGRPDVLPVDDFGVRKGYAAAYRKRALPAPRDLAKYGARWAPYRTVASWYLWQAAAF
ncbi:MAG TPA: methylated-DNA--[protein]-cysteine S-methyltransferase [Myxococcota bacterium]|nr:methylated-DNA--[protein]-cysteine S-methyltransferase [Myxococcota bacterium]